VIDDLWLGRAFGYDAEAPRRAKQFAEDRHCGFIYDTETDGTFIRAYINQGSIRSSPN
jgi:hypothetical protein